MEDGSTSLKLKVELETTDTGEVKSINSFIDSGATGEFIDRHYAKINQLYTWKLSKPILVYNVDGTLNKAGSITEVVDLILRYRNHLEQTLFAVTGLGKQKLILGHSWLWKHNPEIDWVTREVKMSRCPPWCCSGCRDKAWEERIAWKAEIWWMEAVSDGPVPELHTDSEEEEPEEAEEPIEPGDCLFAIGLVPAPAEIWATSSVSQRLAEAFKHNSKVSAPSGWSILEYLKEFDSVFSKESFDALPESKKWDHAVKLIPGEKASNCKVYPLAPTEQKELDQFLKENLETGWIHLSKSPMASPVFFIKKDSTLWLVQDYWALNAMMVKNKYLLPLISKLIDKLRGAKYFTKLDVWWGFNNVQMKEGDEWKCYNTLFTFTFTFTLNTWTLLDLIL